MVNINTANMTGDMNALTIDGTIKANQPIKANVILGGGGGGGELEPRVAALEEQVIVINQNMSSLQDDIDTINRDISALTDRVLINETDINTLNVDVADLKSESEELTTRITVAEQTLGAIQMEVTALSTRLDIDEEIITVVQQKVEALQTTLGNISRNITELQRRVANLETGIGVLSGQIQDVVSDISTLEADMMAVEGDIAGLQADVTTLQSDVNTLQSDVNTLQSDVNTLQSDVNTLQSDVNTLQSDVLEIQSELENKISKDTLATSTTLGLVKLYNETGNHEDGTITQKAATNAINNALTIANQADQAAGIAIGNAARAINIAETDNTSTSAGRVASGAGHLNRVWGTDDNGNPSWTKPIKVYDASGSATIWTSCEVRYYRGDHTLPTLLWNVPNTPWISNFIYTVVLDGNNPISIEANPIDYSTKAYIWNAISNWIALN